KPARQRDSTRQTSPWVKVLSEGRFAPCGHPGRGKPERRCLALAPNCRCLPILPVMLAWTEGVRRTTPPLPWEERGAGAVFLPLASQGRGPGGGVLLGPGARCRGDCHVVACFGGRAGKPVPVAPVALRGRGPQADRGTLRHRDRRGRPRRNRGHHGRQTR